MIPYRTNRRSRHMTGMTLLDVVLAMAIFGFGMLALVKLQGNLGRSMVSANTATIASNIAEETIEDLRAFEQITTDPNGVKSAYNDIVDGTFAVNRGGQVFDVTLDVRDWYFQADRVSVSETPSVGKAYSDFKTLDVNVTWAGAEFQTDFDQTDGVDTNSRLGTGNITVSGIVPSMPSLGSAQIASQGDPDGFGITANYTPGQNPDIVSLQIDTSKYKETTTPEPVVYRSDELAESWFDVITYNQLNSEATFLRREEFLAVSCDCTLKAPTGGDDGYRPMLWKGSEYSEPEFASKSFGVSASNKQSFYCDVCCRDHHDGGSSAPEDLVDPFRPSGDYVASGVFAGDHKHYKRDNNGALILADTADDDYVEACRMVRKDGFMHLVQDFKQQAMFAFPEDYLVDSSDINQYSDYLAQAVTAYEADLDDCQAEASCTGYTSSPPTWLSPGSATPPVVFPASTSASPSDLPTVLGANEQQLRSRGIYLDFLSDELRWVINCMQISGNTGADCGADGATSVLEVIPFFDVQLTKLSRWNEDPLGTPIEITNETVATDNSHSRGLAKKLAGEAGLSEASAISHKGNLGLTATDPIDVDYANKLATPKVYLLAVDADDPSATPPDGLIVSGGLSTSVDGFQVSNVAISGINGVMCNQTDVTFNCLVTSGASAPRLSVSGLTKGNRNYYACSSSPLLTVYSAGSGTTVFDLPTSGNDVTGVSIVIQATSCP